MIKDNLSGRHMVYEGVDVEQGGPWGYRHQFNIADSGYGLRGPRVQNDRAGEVGRTLNVKDFNLDRLFGEEGVQILHLSGLIAALSPETSNFCLELARSARKVRDKDIIRSQFQGFLLEEQGKGAFCNISGKLQVSRIFWLVMKRIFSFALV